jgi:hypothetical protein
MKESYLGPKVSDLANLTSPGANPHVLWRQILGFTLWVGLPALAVHGPLLAMFCLALGGVTLADAWISGIYKVRGKRSFLNISPMGWGIAMPVLFFVTYPAYLGNRNKLRTIQGTNSFYWATIILGQIAIIWGIDLLIGGALRR